MKKGDWQGLAMLLGMFLLFAGVIFLIPRGGGVTGSSSVDMKTAELSIIKQSAEGLEIDFSIEGAGFLSIHRAMGDAPGEILKQVAVFDGEGQVMTVPVEGLEGPVILLLFSDDGDGVFERGVDLPVQREGVSVRAEAILKNGSL
jgi:hypothetical protein